MTEADKAIAMLNCIKAECADLEIADQLDSADKLADAALILSQESLARLYTRILDSRVSAAATGA